MGRAVRMLKHMGCGFTNRNNELGNRKPANKTGSRVLSSRDSVIISKVRVSLYLTEISTKNVFLLSNVRGETYIIFRFFNWYTNASILRDLM